MNSEDRPVTPEVSDAAPKAAPPSKQWSVGRISPGQVVLILILLCVKLFLAYYLLLLTLVCIHELGHLIAGLACGLRLLSIRVGSLSISRPVTLASESSTKWYWDWGWRKMATGGVQMYATQQSMLGIRWRYFVYIIAGPLANLGFGLLAIPFATRDTGFGAVAKFFVLGSLVLGIGNLFSFKRYGLQSDGSQLVALLFSKRRREPLLFGCTLVARIEKIQALCLEGQAQHASHLAEELVRGSESIPALSGSEEYMVYLTKLTAFIQQAVDNHSPAQDPISVSTQQALQDPGR